MGADTNANGFYAHFEETDPDLFRQFTETYVEVTFTRTDVIPHFKDVCDRCGALVMSRDKHAAWHRETSSVIYVLGSGVKTLAAAEPEETFEQRERRMRAEGTWEQ